jgi:glutathione synthase/RimK-type ligase-like ATP-grasp enzyme
MLFVPAHERGVRWLAGALASRGAAVVTIDPWSHGAFAVSDGAQGDSAILHLAEKSIELRSIAGVWARWASPLRPTTPGTSAHLARHEWAAFWRGAFRHIRGNRFVNSEGAVRAASDRLTQADTARRIGFKVPATLVSSSTQHLLEFVDRHERVITKPLSSGRTEDAGRRTLFATELTRSSLAGKKLKVPALVQEYCSVDIEIRCTVVDGRVFAASIPRLSDAIDVKHAVLAGALYSPIRLSSDEEERVLSLVRSLGLRFAAVDLGRQRHGPPVLFEVNGAGQYQGIEEQTGLPITDAVATALLEAVS